MLRYRSFQTRNLRRDWRVSHDPRKITSFAGAHAALGRLCSFSRGHGVACIRLCMAKSGFAFSAVLARQLEAPLSFTGRQAVFRVFAWSSDTSTRLRER